MAALADVKSLINPEHDKESHGTNITISTSIMTTRKTYNNFTSICHLK